MPEVLSCFSERHEIMTSKNYIDNSPTEPNSILDSFLFERPQTLESMQTVAQLAQEFQSESLSSDSAHFPSTFSLRETVGFDKAQFNVDIVGINYERLIESKKALLKNSYSDLPRIIIEYTDPDNPNDFPLVLPMRENNIKKIEVTLSHYVQFVFKRNNTPLMDDGRRKSDIYLLKTTVEPPSGLEALGNLNNYNYEEMKNVIETAIIDLYYLTGIEINPKTVRLNDIELNLTFVQNCDFNNLMRSVSYYQNYTRRGYSTKEYKEADEESVIYDSKPDNRTRSKLKIYQPNLRMCTTGFVTANQSIAVKLYDKKRETITYAEEHGYSLEFENGFSIIRLEFEIRNRKQLQKYFKSQDKLVFFDDLSQADIECTYVTLVHNFFKAPYEEKYVPESICTLKNIIETLDTSRKGGLWKQELIREVLSQEIWAKATPALLSEKDILSVMKYNRTFATHPARYKKVLLELLKESSHFKRGQNTAYQMLYDFLNKTFYLASLSSNRELGFDLLEFEPENT